MPAIREIGSRAHEPGRHSALTQRLNIAIDVVRENLRSAPPRVVSANDNSRNLNNFTDGSFEAGNAEWGFFLHDASTDEKFVAGGKVPAELVDYWLAIVGKQIITQVELMAVLIARRFLGRKCLGRKVIWWIDNDAAKDSLISGYSDSIGSQGVIYSFYECERMFPSYLWFARVPTFPNIADDPSRGRVQQTADKFGATVVDVTITKDDIREIKSFTARHKKP